MRCNNLYMRYTAFISCIGSYIELGLYLFMRYLRGKASEALLLLES